MASTSANRMDSTVPLPGRRATQTSLALSKATSRVIKVVTDPAVSQAFPFAPNEVVKALAEQTRSLLEHHFADRWESLTKQASFIELCNALDEVEEAAVARAASGTPTTPVPTDPTLSLPPLLLPLLEPLQKTYASLIKAEAQATRTLHADIVRKAKDVERLEKELRARAGGLKKAVGELEGGEEGWRVMKDEGLKRIGEGGL